MMLDISALREELASPEHDDAARERIAISAMKQILLAHSRAGTWRGDDASAIDVLHQAGFSKDEVTTHHMDAIDLITWDGLVLELCGSAIVVLIGIGTWCAWWTALPAGMGG